MVACAFRGLCRRNRLQEKRERVCLSRLGDEHIPSSILLPLSACMSVLLPSPPLLILNSPVGERREKKTPAVQFHSNTQEKTHLLPPETEFAGVRVRGSRGVPWFLGLEGVAGEDAGLMVEMAVGVLLTLAVGEASWAWEVDSLDTEKCSDEGSKTMWLMN